MTTFPWLSAAISLFALQLGACGAIKTAATPPPTTFYSLDDARNETTAKSRRWRDEMPRMGYGAPAPTLIVNPPQAGSGYDSSRIVYTREPHRLEYFAHSEWVDTPARMIEPLIIAAIEGSEVFRAVVSSPSAAAGELRLSTEIVRLRQDFSSTPSRVHFTLRAYIADNNTRRVLAQQEFDVSVVASGDDPRSGVLAANQAVREVLQALADFAADAAKTNAATGARPTP
jgi:cholesterol transport system auxiliary component